MIGTIRRQTGSAWARGGDRGQFVIALAIGAVLALISWQVGVLDGSTDIFGGVAG